VPLPDGARLGFPCPLFALTDHHARERDTPSSRSARLRRTWPRGLVVALTEQGRLRQRQPQVAHVAFVLDPARGAPAGRARSSQLPEALGGDQPEGAGAPSLISHNVYYVKL
jgi:hypothetical protein